MLRRTSLGSLSCRRYQRRWLYLRQSDGQVVTKTHQNLPGVYEACGFPHERWDRSKDQLLLHKVRCWRALAAHSGKPPTSDSTTIPIGCEAPELVDPPNRMH